MTKKKGVREIQAHIENIICKEMLNGQSHCSQVIDDMPEMWENRETWKHASSKTEEALPFENTRSQREGVSVQIQARIQIQ